MDKDKVLNIGNIALACTMIIGITTFRVYYNPSTISKETLAVASAKCAYNGETLRPTIQNRFAGLDNLKSITGPAPFSDSYSVTCDNDALFKFTAKWKESLTETIKTDTIMAPEK